MRPQVPKQRRRGAFTNQTCMLGVRQNTMLAPCYTPLKLKKTFSQPMNINCLAVLISHIDHLGEATNRGARFEEVRREDSGYE